MRRGLAAALRCAARILGGASRRPIAGEAAAREPLIRPERYAFFDKLLFAVFVLAVPPFIASNWSVFRDGDVSWHVAAGRWILEHGRVPKTDPFSFTMAGDWILLLTGETSGGVQFKKQIEIAGVRPAS